MSIKLPTDLNSKWTQPNNSDKFGSLWMTKNINLDEAGYIKLSPRSVLLYNEDLNADFGVPIALGRFASGNYLVGTTSNANFNVSIDQTSFNADENDGTSEPTMTQNSHGVFWQNLWHASTATAVLSRDVSADESETWTSRITGLTSGVRHYMEVFSSYNSLCVSNGNTVIRTTPTLYTTAVTLSIPSDFEIIGMAYNNARMGIITRLGSDSEGQNTEAKFYIWDGATAAANSDASVGSDACVAICAYKSSFAVLTRAGQLLYWNGGGFDVLANFPFFYSGQIVGSLTSLRNFGDSMTADGDVIYINLGGEVNNFGIKGEKQIQNCPSGVWCYDPEVGLYHRYSPSISPAYFHSILNSNINTTTDIFTTSATIPPTGSIARYMFNGNDLIGGLELNNDYYVIKLNSTTFKLAETRADAIAGISIDLTSVGTGSSDFFWMYDIVDYGNSHHQDVGAIALTGETTNAYRDIIFGGDYTTTADSSRDSLCIAVPFLSARGYFVTFKRFSSEVTDTNQKIFVKFRPLGPDDSIIVKIKTENIYGLPASSPNNTSQGVDEANWTSPLEFYTQTNLSAAKSYLDSGGDLECEFVSGAGGGVMVKIVSIATDAGVYSVVLEEEVIGASSGLKSNFIIDNWKYLRTITNADTDYVEIPIGGQSKFAQFKVELRGVETTIEDLDFVPKTNKPSK